VVHFLGAGFAAFAEVAAPLLKGFLHELAGADDEAVALSDIQGVEAGVLHTPVLRI
jgi:hypothetical protein